MSLTRLEEVGSTNTWLKERCADLLHGDAVTALRQTEGRGRTGHTWLDAEGMLPLSVLLKSPPDITTLTLRVCIAVCRVLEPIAGEPLSIKWTNDIILRGHKLCGILCESVQKRDGLNVICGIGVNLTQPQEYFETAGIPHGGSLLSLVGAKCDREELALQLVSAVEEYAALSFRDLREEYVSRCITLGREVRLLGREERTVFAEGITDSGALVCRDENGRFEVTSGEVSVRGLLDYI